MSWQTRYSTSSCRWCGTLTLPPSMPPTRPRAIHAANLADVTSADVNALIPVVSESLSTAVPGTGADL